MKCVYLSADAVQCGWLESILEGAGIDCLVRNRYLGGAIGELPINEAWPEIWVVNDTDLARARDLIQATLTPQPARADWRCEKCDELIEGQFRQCWNCSSERPFIWE